MFHCFYLRLFYPDEIAKLFPNLFGQPSAKLVPGDSNKVQPDKKLKIGVVLSGGQAPGGHNVISGIFGNYYFSFNELIPINTRQSTSNYMSFILWVLVILNLFWR